MTSHTLRFMKESGIGLGACWDPPLTEEWARSGRARRAAERAMLAIAVELEQPPPDCWVDMSDGRSAFRVESIPGGFYVRAGERIASARGDFARVNARDFGMARVRFCSEFSGLALGWEWQALWCAAGAVERRGPVESAKAWVFGRAEAFAAADAWLAERGLT